MDCKPANNYLLVEIEQIKLASGIHVPDSKQYAHFIVRDVGPGKLLDSGQRAKPSFVAGDRILIHELANKSGRVQALASALFDGRELLLVDAGDVIGVTSGEVLPAPPKIVTAQRKLQIA